MRVTEGPVRGDRDDRAFVEEDGAVGTTTLIADSCAGICTEVCVEEKMAAMGAQKAVRSDSAARYVCVHATVRECISRRGNRDSKYSRNGPGNSPTAALTAGDSSA